MFYKRNTIAGLRIKHLTGFRSTCISPPTKVFRVVTKNHVSPGIPPGLFLWSTERRYLLNFDAFSLHALVSAGIASAGYAAPTPIQARAIPPILTGRDVMGLAQTGTGKTAAFVLPILHRLLAGTQNSIRALVVAPTRELAEQIHQTDF